MQLHECMKFCYLIEETVKMKKSNKNYVIIHRGMYYPS